MDSAKMLGTADKTSTDDHVDGDLRNKHKKRFPTGVVRSTAGFARPVSSGLSNTGFAFTFGGLCQRLRGHQPKNWSFRPGNSCGGVHCGHVCHRHCQHLPGIVVLFIQEVASVFNGHTHCIILVISVRFLVRGSWWTSGRDVHEAWKFNSSSRSREVHWSR